MSHVAGPIVNFCPSLMYGASGGAERVQIMTDELNTRETASVARIQDEFLTSLHASLKDAPDSFRTGALLGWLSFKAKLREAELEWTWAAIQSRRTLRRLVLNLLPQVRSRLSRESPADEDARTVLSRL
jgi:hypothetical protein